MFDGEMQIRCPDCGGRGSGGTFSFGKGKTEFKEDWRCTTCRGRGIVAIQYVIKKETTHADKIKIPGISERSTRAGNS